jgi:hypothetical protein
VRERERCQDNKDDAKEARIREKSERYERQVNERESEGYERQVNERESERCERQVIERERERER